MTRDEILDRGGSINLVDTADDADITVTLNNPTDPHRTLSCEKCPLGSQKPQTDFLIRKGSKFGRSLARSSLSRHKGFLACEAIISLALLYPLATSFLSEAQIRLIQRPFMSNAARLCGLNGNTSRAILFGPRDTGGLGLTDFAASQSWLQLDLLMHHIR